MTPVISPWVFYLMPVCENLMDLAWVACFITGVTLVILFIGYIINTMEEDDDVIRIIRKLCKTVLPIFVITALLATLIPTEETMIKMIVAQNVTVERIDVVSDTVVTVYNDIMNLFSGAANG